MVMVHRHNKFLYRIVKDPKTGIDCHEKHKMGLGFTGVVAMSGKLLHTRELKNDIYFLEELDDPNYDRKN